MSQADAARLASDLGFPTCLNIGPSHLLYLGDTAPGIEWDRTLLWASRECQGDTRLGAVRPPFDGLVDATAPGDPGWLRARPATRVDGAPSAAAVRRSSA